MSKIISFKSDKFKKHREGQSRWLLLHCEKCANPIALYQKDGPGPLKRLYLDRIFTPNIPSQTRELICKNCKIVIGAFYIYEKEKRPSFRLYQSAVFKKLAKNIKK